MLIPLFSLSLSPGPTYHIHEMTILHVLVFFSYGGGAIIRDRVVIRSFTVIIIISIYLYVCMHAAARMHI